MRNAAPTARTLGRVGAEVKLPRTAEGLALELPCIRPNPHTTVIDLMIAGELEIVH